MALFGHSDNAGDGSETASALLVYLRLALRIPLMNSIKLIPPKGQTFQTKQALVYHTLRDAIMQARLEPGERLIIDDIAKRLEVSPIPVREALQQLQAERLVEHKVHVGAVVAALTPEAASEIFALLECLETVVFRGAVAHVTAADLKGLGALVERMKVATEDVKWMDLNLRFHRTIAEIAQMPRAMEMLERVSSEWERLRRFRFRDVGHPDTAIADHEHLAMITALEAKNVGQLEALVRQHNRSALAFYLGSGIVSAQPSAP